MLYEKLARSYDKIEAYSRRMEMIDQLIETLLDVGADEMEASIRLTQGSIFPGYSGLDLGIGEKMVLKAMNQITSISESEAKRLYKGIGDIGRTAEVLSSQKKQAALFHEPLTVLRVYYNMLRIAKMHGRSSQDNKLKVIAEMMHDASPLESRYIARTLCQKMRIGISDMTLIDALAHIFHEGFRDPPSHLFDQNNNEELKEAILSLRSNKISAINRTLQLLKIESRSGQEPGKARKSMDYLMDQKILIQALRSSILRSYNVHPDLAYIAKSMKLHGRSILDSIKIECGVPIMSMLGERLHSIDDIMIKLKDRCALEYKYDGLRLQAHVSNIAGNRTVRLFSRQLENITDQFPEIADGISSNALYDCILDGECVPVDRITGEMLPFQVISQRRGRKFELDRMIDEIPVKYIVFDCMYIDGVDITNSSYTERRSAINRIFAGIKDQITADELISLSKMSIVSSVDDAKTFFESSIKYGCEGIMAKSISDNSTYQAGGRGFLWIKYKREYMKDHMDTFDLVIVGGFKGIGKRAGLIGAYLGAVYDPENDRFETLCKIGSGFKDEDLKNLNELVKPLLLDRWGRNSDVRSQIIPDVFIEPSIVIEVIGAEISFSPVHTCAIDILKNGSGMALRFPRFTGRYRNDKAPEQATTNSEIYRMYEEQIKSMKS